MITEVKLKWYLKVLTGSVAMQVSMRSYQLFEQIDGQSTKLILTIMIDSNLVSK